jgi:hypothetical protein
VRRWAPASGSRVSANPRRRCERSLTLPEEVITVYDERGRELEVKRADWVDSVLAPPIDKAWNDPKALLAHIRPRNAVISSYSLHTCPASSSRKWSHQPVDGATNAPPKERTVSRVR